MMNFLIDSETGQRVSFERMYLSNDILAPIIVATDILPYTPDKKVVLVNRKAEPARHLWWFGGPVYPGEDFDAAALRKFKQDTGLKLNSHNLQYFEEVRYFWPTRQQQPQNLPCDILTKLFVTQITRREIEKINEGLNPDEYEPGSATAYTYAQLQELQAAGELHPATLLLSAILMQKLR